MNIINFGSLNIDHVYRVDHFVQPGETISSENLEYFCGGKGLNQSIAVSRAGANVFHAGKIGADGDILKETLNANGVNTDYISKTNGVNGHAVIQVNSSGQNCIIIYGGTNTEITEKDADAVLERFSPGDMVLMQNETSCTSYIARRCAQKRMRVAFNPSPVSKSLLSDFPFDLVSLFFINEVEGQALTQKTEPSEILAGLSEKYPESACVLTLGKRGAAYHDNNCSFTHGTYDVPVIDTTAAGDTFTGYYIACLVNGMNIKACLEKASAASSLAVSKKGASSSIPFMAEVDDALKHLKYVPF